MREVARKAGVSHQAPYHHFGDREAILAALAGEGFAKLKQELERAAASTGDDATKAVEAMGCAYVDFALRHPAYFQVMFRARCRAARELSRGTAAGGCRLRPARADDRRRFRRASRLRRGRKSPSSAGPWSMASQRFCSKAVSPARSGYRRRGRGSSPRRSSKPSARFWSEAALEDAAAAREVYQAARNERDLAVS